MKNNSLEKEKIMDFGKMVEGLFKFYKKAIVPEKVKRKYGYSGLDVTSDSILVSAFSITDELSEGVFLHDIREGRHPIQILLGCAIKLGIQQGLNMCSNNPTSHLENVSIEELKHLIDLKKFMLKQELKNKTVSRNVKIKKIKLNTKKLLREAWNRSENTL